MGDLMSERMKIARVFTAGHIIFLHPPFFLVRVKRALEYDMRLKPRLAVNVVLVSYRESENQRSHTTVEQLTQPTGTFVDL